MDKPICLECGKGFTNDGGLHKHLKTHKLIMSAYYHKHFPRHDKYDGALIKFRSKESYFYTDFNSKENLKYWLEKVTKDEARLYIKSYFFNRKERKKLIYAPTQVELRSLPIPGMKYLNSLFGSYKELCDVVGLKLKHKKNNFELPFRDLSNNKIQIDTREQNPLEFTLNIEKATLPFGDYRLASPDPSCLCYIERKSLNDFHGTLGRDFFRFKREFDKARDSGAYLIVVVESPFGELYNFATSKFLNKPLGGGEQRDEKPVISSADHIFHNMREILKEYDDVQFLFVNNREESARVIEKVFSSNCEFKDIDLQYLYDIGKL